MYLGTCQRIISNTGPNQFYLYHMSQFNYPIGIMNYDHIRDLAHVKDEEIIAAAEIWTDIDDKVISVFKEYKLLVCLWEKDKENESLKQYLDHVYWNLMKEIRIATQLRKELGHGELSVTFEISELYIHNN